MSFNEVAQRIILSIALILVFTGATKSQSIGHLDTVQLDPAVRMGKLSNGFTYYIRKNQHPEGKVQMNLVVNAGVLHQDPDQLGLAHLLEHMGFNELNTFPQAGSFTSYLDRSGLQRGRDWNASTSNITNYYLILPVNRPSLVDTGFLVLRDWAHGIILTPKSIDDERKVVIGEIRQGHGYYWKLMLQTEARLANHLKYITNDGELQAKNIIDFRYEALERFYNDWYRPDLQAAIIVGDIDVDQVEAKVKELFKNLRMPLHTRHSQGLGNDLKINLDGKNNLIVLTDAQMPNIEIEEYCKIKRVGKTLSGLDATLRDYRESLLTKLYDILLRTRLNSHNQRYNAPSFRLTSTFQDGFPHNSISGISAIRSAVSVASPRDIKYAFQQLITELERIKVYGFSETELQEAKAAVEEEITNNKRSSTTDIVSVLIGHFTEGAAAPSPEYLLHLKSKLLTSITLDEANKRIKGWISDVNRSLVIRAPDSFKRELPGEATIQAWRARVKASKITRYEMPPSLVDSPLLSPCEEPKKAGRIVFSEKDDQTGITRLELDNGINIYLKYLSQDGVEKNVRIRGFSDGGLSAYSDDKKVCAKYLGSIIYNTGVGRFNKFHLKEVLKTKLAYPAAPYLSDERSVIEQFTDSKNVETALQLIYLYFTSPRKDPVAFEDWMNTARRQAQTKEVKSFATHFHQMVKETRFGKDAVNNKPTKEQLQKIELEKVFNIYKENFSDPAGFTFVVSGDFDETIVTSLLVKYLGGIPRNSLRTDSPPVNSYILNRKVNKYYYAGEADRAEVDLNFVGKYVYNDRNNLLLDILGRALNIKIVERVREKEGGAYGPRAEVNYSKQQEGTYNFNIHFDCAPDKSEYLVSAAVEEVEKLRTGGLDNELVEKAMASQREQKESDTNSLWMYYLNEKFEQGGCPLTPKERQQVLNDLTLKEIQSAAAIYLNSDSLQRFVWLPEILKPNK